MTNGYEEALHGIDAARRAGWARAYAAEKRVLELEEIVAQCDSVLYFDEEVNRVMFYNMEHDELRHLKNVLRSCAQRHPEVMICQLNIDDMLRGHPCCKDPSHRRV